MQVPSARIIELINNVAQRGMAVIKEPWLCVLRCCGLLHGCLCVCLLVCACLRACMCVCVHSGGECVQIAGRVDVERGHCRHRD